MVLCVSCLGNTKISTARIPEKKSYLNSAVDYLNLKIKDKKILKKIVFDTTMRHSSNMVLFNVMNDSDQIKRNMIIVHVNNNFLVDTQFTKIETYEIRNHIKNPSIHPLLISRIGAVKLAEDNGIEKGIAPWTVYLVCYAGKRDDVQWTIRNMKKESNRGTYRASGQSINIKVETGETNVGWWQAIE